MFFDTHLYHTMPYADILPWDQISVMIDFDWLEQSKLNALDVLNERFTREGALEMAWKVCSLRAACVSDVGPPRCHRRLSRCPPALHSRSPWETG